MMLLFYFTLFVIRVLMFLQCPGTADASASSYWVANIKRQGIVPFGEALKYTYPVYRNVQDYGAKGMLIAAYVTAILTMYR